MEVSNGLVRSWKVLCSCQMGVIMSMRWNRGHWRIAAFTIMSGFMSPHVCYPLRALGCQRSLGPPWVHSMPRRGWIEPSLTWPVFLFVMMLSVLTGAFLPCIFLLKAHNNDYANTIILIFKFEHQVCFRCCFIFNPERNPVRIIQVLLWPCGETEVQRVSAHHQRGPSLWRTIWDLSPNLLTQDLYTEWLHCNAYLKEHIVSLILWMRILRLDTLFPSFYRWGF